MGGKSGIGRASLLCHPVWYNKRGGKYWVKLGIQEKWGIFFKNSKAKKHGSGKIFFFFFFFEKKNPLLPKKKKKKRFLGEKKKEKRFENPGKILKKS